MLSIFYFPVCTINFYIFHVTLIYRHLRQTFSRTITKKIVKIRIFDENHPRVLVPSATTLHNRNTPRTKSRGVRNNYGTASTTKQWTKARRKIFSSTLVTTKIERKRATGGGRGGQLTEGRKERRRYRFKSCLSYKAADSGKTERQTEKEKEREKRKKKKKKKKIRRANVFLPSDWSDLADWPSYRRS